MVVGFCGMGLEGSRSCADVGTLGLRVWEIVRGREAAGYVW